MVVLDNAVIFELAPAAGALASLRTHALRDGYHAWHGASGRRYVASVFPLDSRDRDAGLPAFDSFVLITVARDGRGHGIRRVEAIECGSARHRAIAAGLADGVDEWHVHLLGASRVEREAIVADLRAGAGFDRLAHSA